MTMIGSPACPLGRLEGQARGGGEGEGRCRLSSPPPKGATPCDRPPRGAILIPRPLGVVDYSAAEAGGDVVEYRGRASDCGPACDSAQWGLEAGASVVLTIQDAS